MPDQTAEQARDALRTKVAVALHNAECPGRNCSDPDSLGAWYRQADVALEVAREVIAAQATAAVCDWLVTEVGFPFDFTFGDKPAWLDLHQVAEAWHRHDPREDVETWLLTIIDETGWEATGAE